MALAPGSEVFIRYTGHPTCHRRYLVAHAANADWIVATPDGDLYEESMQRTNGDAALTRGHRDEIAIQYADDHAELHDWA